MPAPNPEEVNMAARNSATDTGSKDFAFGVTGIGLMITAAVIMAIVS
jgi:hypothetical protein